ncbi:hypothetical protein EV182_006631, partial [Spiromyces aspiralis]
VLCVLLNIILSALFLLVSIVISPLLCILGLISVTIFTDLKNIWKKKCASLLDLEGGQCSDDSGVLATDVPTPDVTDVGISGSCSLLHKYYHYQLKPLTYAIDLNPLHSLQRANPNSFLSKLQILRPPNH